jgi:hypothetical protein
MWSEMAVGGQSADIAGPNQPRYFDGPGSISLCGFPPGACDAQSIARSDLRWRRDLLLDHQLLDRHHLLVVEEEPEPAPEIQFVPAPVTGSIGILPAPWATSSWYGT